MKLLRTPDERFANLPGYDFEPHYAEVDGLRVHYLDQGRREGEVVLLMHGEPSWSYLYRKMIPVLVAAGLRAVAPGPGRLRPLRQAGRAARTTPTSATSTGCAASCSTSSTSRRSRLVGQDWGGLIGLRLVAEHGDRFARVVAANTGLPTGDGKPTEAFEAWQNFSQDDARASRSAASSRVACVTDLSPEVVAAYDAPFPDESYKAGRPPVPAPRADVARRPSGAGQPEGVGGARAWESRS